MAFLILSILCLLLSIANFFCYFFMGYHWYNMVTGIFSAIVGVISLMSAIEDLQGR